MANNEQYNPWRLPWLSIVNYLKADCSNEEVALVITKLKEHYRDNGPLAIALSLEQGVRIDRARPILLAAVLGATWEWQATIKGWTSFRGRVEAEFSRRGVNLLLGPM